MTLENVTLKDNTTLLDTPFEYTLVDSANPHIGKEGPVTFNSFGCPEDEDFEGIKQVGDLAKKVGANASFGVLLGDNNRPKGVKDKNDEIFKTFFHEVHQQVIFAILGNHDAPNKEASLDQILHTFVDIDTGEFDPIKVKIWNNTIVDLAELRTVKNNWNMPGRYGVYHCGHSDLFVIDSTNFVADFINYFILKTDTNPNNQVAWLFRAAPESKALHKIILSHHAFHDISKRKIVSDHPDYLNPAQVELLEAVGIKGNYNEMLNQILFLAAKPEKGWPRGPGPVFSEAETAHHHSINYFDGLEEKESKTAATSLAQMGSGGAGGQKPKQHRFDFKSHKHIPFSTTDHGFIQKTLTADGQSQGVIHTYSGFCVHINNRHIVKQPREEKIANLEKRLIETCQSFQAFLAEHPISDFQPRYKVKGKVFDWVPSSYTFSDDIQNFCNRFEPHSEEELRAFLMGALKQSMIDPKEELVASLPKGYFDLRAWSWWGCYERAEYFPTLRKHQQQWKETWEPIIRELFNVSFDEFIQPLVSLKAATPITPSQSINVSVSSPSTSSVSSSSSVSPASMTSSAYLTSPSSVLASTTTPVHSSLSVKTDLVFEEKLMPPPTTSVDVSPVAETVPVIRLQPDTLLKVAQEPTISIPTPDSIPVTPQSTGGLLAKLLTDAAVTHIIESKSAPDLSQITRAALEMDSLGTDFVLTPLPSPLPTSGIPQPKQSESKGLFNFFSQLFFGNKVQTEVKTQEPKHEPTPTPATTAKKVPIIFKAKSLHPPHSASRPIFKRSHSERRGSLAGLNFLHTPSTSCATEAQQQLVDEFESASAIRLSSSV